MSKHALFIEPDFVMRKVGVTTLSRWGFDKVSGVASIQEAKEVLSTEHVDLIVSEALVPDGSYRDALNYMRSIPSQRNTLFAIETVILTSELHAEMQQDGINLISIAPLGDDQKLKEFVQRSIL